MPDVVSTTDPLLDGFDHLPDEFERFLCALVRGLRAEDRHPTTLRAFKVKEPTLLTHPDGGWQYLIEYFDTNLESSGPCKRVVAGTWK